MKHKKAVSATLSMLILGTTILPCYGSETQKDITGAQTSQDAIQSKLNDTQDKLSSLRTQKGELETYLSDLNSQLSKLGDSLEDLQIESKEKQTELESIQASLERARRNEENQYESMKLRIKYLYENASGSYVNMLFKAASFSEFLNRADAIIQLSEYDRNMLQEFQTTQEIIAQREEDVKKEQYNVEKLKTEQLSKQAEIEALVNSTGAKLSEYQTSIDDAEKTAQKYLEQIEGQKKQIDFLLSKEKADQAEKERMAKKAEILNSKNEKAKESSSADASDSDKSETPETKEIEIKESEIREPELEQPESEQLQTDEQVTELPQEQTVQEEIQEEPVEEPSEEPSEQSSGGTYLGHFTLTAYCGCAQCCGSAGKPTASGVMPTSGHTVAMGGIEFGTKLLINGVVYTVEDRGTPYGHVDIYMDSHSAALNFGMQSADVYIVG